MKSIIGQAMGIAAQILIIGVKKVERTFWPVKSKFARVDGAWVSVEIESRQSGADQKVSQNGGTAQQTSHRCIETEVVRSE